MSDGLDLRNYETAPKDADYYWIGDADPDKARDTLRLLPAHPFVPHTDGLHLSQVSDDEIEAFIRKYGQSSAHPVSDALPVPSST